MFVLRVIKEPGCILYYAGSYDFGYMFTQLKVKAFVYSDRENAIDMAKKLSDIIGLDFVIDEV